MAPTNVRLTWRLLFPAPPAAQIDILTAIKDFKHGIYTAQWEAAAADMTLDDLRAKIRDLQLLHVTRDMQVRRGGARAALREPQGAPNTTCTARKIPDPTQVVFCQPASGTPPVSRLHPCMSTQCTLRLPHC